MARIKKGFSVCTAIVGVVCLITGIGISICAWVLKSSFPNGFSYHSYDGDESRSGEVTLGNYWWGGIIYILPGIMGIVAGCTRNVIAMIFYLVFNLVCCIVSGIVVVLSAMVILMWVVINALIEDGDCETVFGKCICKNEDTIVKLSGKCSQFENVIVIVGAMVAMGCLSSLFSFIASYVSCCSLCNQETEHSRIIITDGTGGLYQPPVAMQSNVHPTAAPQVYPSAPSNYVNNYSAIDPYGNMAQPPPPYDPAGYFGAEGRDPMAYPLSDKSKLVNSEY